MHSKAIADDENPVFAIHIVGIGSKKAVTKIGEEVANFNQGTAKRTVARNEIVEFEQDHRDGAST